MSDEFINLNVIQQKIFSLINFLFKGKFNSFKVKKLVLRVIWQLPKASFSPTLVPIFPPFFLSVLDLTTMRPLREFLVLSWLCISATMADPGYGKDSSGKGGKFTEVTGTPINPFDFQAISSANITDEPSKGLLEAGKDPTIGAGK